MRRRNGRLPKDPAISSMLGAEIKKSQARRACEADGGHDYEETGRPYTFPNGDRGQELNCAKGCSASKILPEEAS